MASILLSKTMDLDQKAAQMQADARFEVSDDREQRLSGLRMGIRGSAPLPRVPKVFLANDCAFNCSYCACRCGNERKHRYETTPRELASLAVKQAMSTGSGIFISSAILRSADYTQERIVETLRVIRQEHGYGGYLHAKVMPGADAELIRKAGTYANRLSVNIEVAKSEGYAKIARNKNKANILGPMGQISQLIRQYKDAKGGGASFATSQTTQLMAGSTGEDDREILRLAHAMYHKYGLSRVYYTSYHYEKPARGYEDLPLTVTPAWRMARLYQADRLLQRYNFAVDEIAPEGSANLLPDMEPKGAWALRNLHLFPIEVNKADFDTLLRIPGIGDVYARRIIAARRGGPLSHTSLRSLGVSLKRCEHFLTCAGRFTGQRDPRAIYERLRTPVISEQLSFDLWGGCD